MGDLCVGDTKALPALQLMAPIGRRPFQRIVHLALTIGHSTAHPRPVALSA